MPFKCMKCFLVFFSIVFMGILVFVGTSSAQTMRKADIRGENPNQSKGERIKPFDKPKKEEEETRNKNFISNQKLNQKSDFEYHQETKEYAVENTEKHHFTLNINPPYQASKENYVKAFSHFSRIEDYRLVNERRSIQIAPDVGTIELYSAQELYEKYGRRIRPNNKTENNLPKIEFIVTEQGMVKERAIK